MSLEPRIAHQTVHSELVYSSQEGGRFGVREEPTIGRGSNPVPSCLGEALRRGSLTFFMDTDFALMVCGCFSRLFFLIYSWTHAVKQTVFKTGICRVPRPACAVMGSGLPWGWNRPNERMVRLHDRGGAGRSLSCASSRSWQPP